MFTAHLPASAPKKQKTDLSTSSSVLTIGNFDGYHLGHQKILAKLEDIAREYRLPAYIVTFEPNPKIFFKREDVLLQTPAQRLSTLRSCGVDGIFVIDFEKTHVLSGEAFIQTFLIERFNMKHLVVGDDFRLGKDRSCTLEMRWEGLAMQNIGCSIVQQVYWGGEAISSSRIREDLRRGQVEDAANMLGRQYSIEGVVVRGDGIGTRIGYPTINVKTENRLLPKGVYITRAVVAGSRKSFWGISNIGNRPTVSGNEERVESYLLHFEGSLYGEDVSLSFVTKIRPEISFRTTQELGAQINRDVAFLKSYLQTNGIPYE